MSEVGPGVTSLELVKVSLMNLFIFIVFSSIEDYWLLLISKGLFSGNVILCICFCACRI